MDAATIARDDYYQTGDYRGMSGIERTYERGAARRKGDEGKHRGRARHRKGPIHGRRGDLQAIPGTAITTSLDARLQALGEELMEAR